MDFSNKTEAYGSKFRHRIIDYFKKLRYRRFWKWRLIRVLSYTVFFGFLMSIYSWMILHVAEGGDKFGAFTEPILAYAGFPRTVKKAFIELENLGIHPTYIEFDPSFEKINRLQKNIYGLNSYWNSNNNKWDIRLFNLRNDQTNYLWSIERNYLKFPIPSIQYHTAVPRHSILSDRKSVITQLAFTPNLLKLDSNSNLIWVNHDYVYHHALSIDHENNIWACTNDYIDGVGLVMNSVCNSNGEVFSFESNNITKIDASTGEVLFNKNVGEIFIENGLNGLLYGMSLKDPFHLNDVEPALENTEHWQQGDVFLSLRNRSLVLLYRPRTNKVLKVIIGPFVNQHDVDIISDNEISVFSNNFIHEYQIDRKTDYNANSEKMDSLNSSEIIIYDFENQKFHTYLNDFFRENHIVTYTEGLIEFLKNGDVFVEQHDFGKVYIVNEKGIIYANQFVASIEGYVSLPNWIRIYQDINF